MVSNKAKARLGLRAALMMARHPTLRRATTRVAAPTAKVIVTRQLRDQMERIGDAATSAASIVVICGPIAAEALGLVDAPKPKRRGPRVAAAAVAVVGVSYVVLRRRGTGPSGLVGGPAGAGSAPGEVSGSSPRSTSSRAVA
jgi:hypothetical protein